MKTPAQPFLCWASRQRISPDAERGSALLVVLIIGTAMTLVFAGIIAYLTAAERQEKRSNLRLESTYAAEYALEKAFADLKSQITATNLPGIAETTQITNLTTAPRDPFSTEKGYNWKAYLTVPTEAGVVVASHSNFDPASGAYRYLTTVEFERTAPGLSQPVQMNLQREWVYTITPLFKYAIFYDNDMELFPGADFVVGGRVHTNGRLYTASTKNLRYKDGVTYVNGVSNQYKDEDTRTEPGDLKAPTYDKGHPSAAGREDPPGTLKKDLEDANHNNDGARELIELPNKWQDDPNKEQRLYTQAGLKVLVNSTGNAVTTDNALVVPANSRLILTEDGTPVPTDDPLYGVINGVFENTTLQDYRENKTMNATAVKVDKLTEAYNSGALPATIPQKWPNNTPDTLKGRQPHESLRDKKLWNGILYVTDVTHSSTSHPVGVKIVNGSKLPDGSKGKAGLTIATANAAYIVGDYNTGGVPAVNDNDEALTASNHAANYEVQPAAVIADAVTVMSKKWDMKDNKNKDYDDKSSVDDRIPTNTTINTALISGIVPTTTDGYSGGVENYIRLLEKWSGDNKRLTYYGSIINLYASKEATARWGGGYYSAPERNWYFDVQFRNPNRLPPGTPTVRGLQRGQWVQLK